MDHENFHAGEREAQERWNSASLWDAARKERLLWDHVPRALHGRLEAAAFFFLATSAPDGRCDCSFKGGGPGLGLAIARGIVQAHHGRIWLESPEHNEKTCPGTTVFIRLPMTNGDSHASA